MARASLRPGLQRDPTLAAAAARTTGPLLPDLAYAAIHGSRAAGLRKVVFKR